VQIVGYDSLEGGLYISDRNDIEYVPLTAGDELSYTLAERHCAGTIHNDRHIRCDASETPYCHDHQDRWVCAICVGECLKDEMDCYEEHAIYLAAFAPDSFKIGVTKLWRVETRLREQGADRAAHIKTVANGRIARELEAEIANTTPVPDRVRVPTKRAGLHQTVDAHAWESLYSQFSPIDTFDFSYGFALETQPMGEVMATGTVVGTKGRLLVLDRGGSTYAVDMRDLVGYEVTTDRNEKQLQSSLGAFS